MTDRLPIRRALISVADKTGLLPLAEALSAQNIEIISTGGSAKFLRDAGHKVIEISDHTGFPEIMDGRVKTLVPQIHGGILARRNSPEHQAQMAEHNIAPIDLVVSNLYPFEATIASGADFEDCIEQIDIGGPAITRAAAKNHTDVAILTDPAQYPYFIEALTEGGTTLNHRRKLAGVAYARTAAYDATIATWLAQQRGEQFPQRLTLTGTLRQPLRYGENPHQQAAFYVTDGAPGLATALQIQGKELSYNNINDTDAALAAVREFTDPTIVIVKHANPCGVATAETLAEAWKLALRCDPISAFGGIVAMNRPLDEATATEIIKIFTEVIIAPEASQAAIAVLARKKNLRLLLTGPLPPTPQTHSLAIKTITGGFLAQTADATQLHPTQLKTVTHRHPTEAEMTDCLFAFQVAKHVKSNAIIYAKNRATTGIGAGQMSRLDSARVANWKSTEAATAANLPHPLSQGSVAASDAFFPFADGLQAIIAAGITTIIQPGGSMRDPEVIAAADAAGIAMVFTGVRHFRH